MDRFDLASGVLRTAITVGFALASLLAAAASQLTWRGARYRRARSRPCADPPPRAVAP